MGWFVFSKSIRLVQEGQISKRLLRPTEIEREGVFRPKAKNARYFIINLS
jgi:hypothetical protein